jgi:hypothetical protein
MFLYSTVSTLKPGQVIRMLVYDSGLLLQVMRQAWHTNCGDGRDDLSELQLVQDGGLTSGVETDLPGRSWSIPGRKHRVQLHIPSISLKKQTRANSTCVSS